MPLPEPSSRHVVVVAGEPSGDQHAADFVGALRRLEPGLQFSGMGGNALRQTGVDLVVDSTSLAVVGLVEVLSHYGQIRRALKRMRAHLAATRPQLLVLVDYVEFNLRLAKTAKSLGIKVLFYVSPQVWAWRPGRIKKIGQVVDAMAVLFPFEVDVYQQHGIAVRYVGNPLVDQVKVSTPQSELRLRFGLAPQQPVLGLCPGSRTGEIKRHLPVMLAACEILNARHPSLQFVLAAAGSIDSDALIAPLIPKNLSVKLVKGQSHEVMASADALLISSGTATLEAGLLGVPMAILYRISPISYQILKRFLLIPNIGLVNIVAGRRVVQEFIQNDATPMALAVEAERLLTDSRYSESIREQLVEVRQKLGKGGGSERVAQMAKELLDLGRLAD